MSRNADLLEKRKSVFEFISIYYKMIYGKVIERKSNLADGASHLINFSCLAHRIIYKCQVFASCCFVKINPCDTNRNIFLRFCSI